MYVGLSRVTIITTQNRRLITPLLTTHEPRVETYVRFVLRHFGITGCPGMDPWTWSEVQQAGHRTHLPHIISRIPGGLGPLGFRGLSVFTGVTVGGPLRWGSWVLGLGLMFEDQGLEKFWGLVLNSRSQAGHAILYPMLE